MTRRYERQQVTLPMQVEVAAVCDGCGVAEAEADFGRLIPVAIEVDLGEEGGSRDQYDYCNRCLIAIADVLVAAGSRSGLVGPEPGIEPLCEHGEEGPHSYIGPGDEGLPVHYCTGPPEPS